MCVSTDIRIYICSLLFIHSFFHLIIDMPSSIHLPIQLVCMCIYIYIYTRMYVCIYIYTYIHTSRYMYAYEYRSLHTHISIYIHIHISIFLSICRNRSLSPYIYTHMSIHKLKLKHTYIHTYIMHMDDRRYLYTAISDLHTAEPEDPTPLKASAPNCERPTTQNPCPNSLVLSAQRNPEFPINPV